MSSYQSKIVLLLLSAIGIISIICIMLSAIPVLGSSLKNFPIDGQNRYEDIQLQDISYSDSLYLGLVDWWHFTSFLAVAYDSIRDLVFCSSERDVYILDSSFAIISRNIHTFGDIGGLFYDATSYYLYIADGDIGLEIWDVSNPVFPTKVGNCDTPGKANGVFVHGQYAFIADWDGYLRIINVSDPYNPQEIGHCDLPNIAINVYISGSYAYIADDYAGLRIVDISNPTSPFEVGNYVPGSSVRGVYVSGSYAYLTCWSTIGLRIIDVSNPMNPYEIGSSAALSYGHNVCVSEPYAYLVCEGYVNPGFAIIDISDPTAPQEIGHYTIGPDAHDVVVFGNYAYVAERRFGSYVIDISTPSNPQQIAYFFPPGTARSV